MNIKLKKHDKISRKPKKEIDQEKLAQETVQYHNNIKKDIQDQNSASTANTKNRQILDMLLESSTPFINTNNNQSDKEQEQNSYWKHVEHFLQKIKDTQLNMRK